MGQEQTGIQGIELIDFSGGLNSNRISSFVEDRDSINCRNVFYDRSFLRYVYGATRVNSTIDGVDKSENVNLIHDYQKRNGDAYEVVVSGDKLFYKNVLAWPDITGTATIADELHTAITFNDIMVGTSLNSTTYKWTGTGGAANLGGSPPSGKYITTFNGRAVIANVDVGGTKYPLRAYYSEIDNVESWDTTDDYWEFESDDAQQITGILQLGQNLIVYKNNSISIVSGYGLSTWQVDRDFIKGVGCVSGHTLKAARLLVNNQIVTAHIFLGRDGLYAFDGSTVTLLSDKVRDYLNEQNTARFEYACGVYNTTFNHYVCFLTASGESQNNAGFIYIPKDRSVWPIYGFNANCVSNVLNQTTKLEEVHFGSNDSIVRKINNSTQQLENNTELVTNGSMEIDANWTSYGSPTTNARSGTQFLHGTYSRRVVTDAVGEGIYQDITTVVGKTYNIVAFIYTVSGEGTLVKTDTDGSNSVTTTSTTTGAAWARIELQFTATATTSRIIISNKTTAASEFFVDDVSCRKVDFLAFWDSKWFDFGDPQEMKLLRECIVYSKTNDDSIVSFRARTDYSTGTGTQHSYDSSNTGSEYGTAIYGSSTYGGQTLVYDDLSTFSQSSFRVMQIRFRTDSVTKPFEVERITINAKPLGRRWVYED